MSTFIFTFPQARRNLRLIHDAPCRNQAWYFFLAYCRRIVNWHFLLWCVLISLDIWPIHKLIKGVFLALFSASVVIFVFVFSFLRVAYFLGRPDSSRFHRRRGFSNRATAAMFMVTVINFLLFSLASGTELATITLFIRKALILDIEYPLSEKRGLVKNTLQSLRTLLFWSASLSVSINLSLLDSVSIHALWRYYSAISLSFGGPGSSSKVDDGSPSYHLCCGLEPWVNRHFP